VLKGRVKFYAVGDVRIGQFDRAEGVLMPGGVRYWSSRRVKKSCSSASV
jgi:hypothetical protein